jgi:hypothetical protein
MGIASEEPEAKVSEPVVELIATPGPVHNIQDIAPRKVKRRFDPEPGPSKVGLVVVAVCVVCIVAEVMATIITWAPS